jgi:glycerophosphoryl diester phosphodiesterase
VHETRGFLRIAHRGASGHCPENTRAALVRAIELRADMVEIDCQLTSDGAAVLLHDETLDRTTSGRGPVRLRTLREVKALDAGGWFSPSYAGEEILTIEEAIEILRGRVSLNLELKGDDAPGRLELVCFGAVSRGAFLDDTVFSSFSAQRMRRLRELTAEARIAILLDAGDDWYAGIDFALALGAEALHPIRSLVDPDRVRDAHASGLDVRVWSVNDPDECRRLVDLGVDGIFTDFPDRLLRIGPRREPRERSS